MTNPPENQLDFVPLPGAFQSITQAGWFFLLGGLYFWGAGIGLIPADWEANFAPSSIGGAKALFALVGLGATLGGLGAIAANYPLHYRFDRTKAQLEVTNRGWFGIRSLGGSRSYPFSTITEVHITPITGEGSTPIGYRIYLQLDPEQLGPIEAALGKNLFLPSEYQDLQTAENVVALIREFLTSAA